MDKGRYVGPLTELKGKTAMIRPTSDPMVVEAQFDEIGLTHPVYGDRLSEGWHPFPVTDFRILVLVRT